MTEDDKNLTDNQEPAGALDEPETEAKLPAEAEAAPDTTPETQVSPPSAQSELQQLGEFVSNLPGWAWWAALVFVLLVIILVLRAVDEPDPVYTEAEQTSTAEFAVLIEAGTAVPEIRATADAAAGLQETVAANADELATVQSRVEEQESLIANATATIDANRVLLFSQERYIEGLQGDTDENETALATAQAELDTLAMEQAESEGSAEELATAQAELAAAQEEIDALSTEQSELAAQAEMVDEAEVLQSRVESLEEDIIAFQADATTRALQIESVYATATAQTDTNVEATVEALNATATAQAQIIETQQAQIDSIRDTLGAIDSDQ